MAFSGSTQIVPADNGYSATARASVNGAVLYRPIYEQGVGFTSLQDIGYATFPEYWFTGSGPRDPTTGRYDIYSSIGFQKYLATLDFQLFGSDKVDYVDAEYYVGPGRKATFYAGAGNDTIVGSMYADNVIDGGLGDDLLSIYTATNAWGDFPAPPARTNIVYGGDGNDQIQIYDRAIDSATIYGGAGDDKIYAGGEGFHTIIADAGNDSISGGNGLDVIVYNEDYRSGMISDAYQTVTTQNYGVDSVSFNNVEYARFTNGTYDFKNRLFSASVTAIGPRQPPAGISWTGQSNRTTSPTLLADSSSYTARYDSQGNLASIKQTFPDGSSDLWNYKQVNGVPVLTAENQIHADKTRDFYQYDLGDPSFSLAHATYDAAGKMVGYEQKRPDGSTRLSAVYASDGSRVTTTYEYTKDYYCAVAAYDASGKLTQYEEKLWDGSSKFKADFGGDGSRTATTYNITGKNYTTMVAGYDVSGTLARLDFTNNDGTHSQTALVAGQSLVSTTGAADHFTSAGGDVFSFVTGFGRDDVRGFRAGSSAGHDLLRLDASQVADYASLQSSILGVGGDTMIWLNSWDNILLKGITPDALTADNFAFVDYSRPAG